MSTVRMTPEELIRQLVGRTIVGVKMCGADQVSQPGPTEYGTEIEWLDLDDGRRLSFEAGTDVYSEIPWTRAVLS